MDFLLGDQLPYGVNRSICSASEWKRRFGGGMSLLLHPARDAFIGGPLLGKRIKRMRTRLARLNGRNGQDPPERADDALRRSCRPEWK